MEFDLIEIGGIKYHAEIRFAKEYRNDGTPVVCAGEGTRVFIEIRNPYLYNRVLEKINENIASGDYKPPF
jgi:hypothetical protein